MRSEITKYYTNIRKLLIGSGIGSYYPIRKANEILLSFLKRDQCVVNGYRMFLDENDSLELSINPEYEPEETEVIKSIVKPGDIAVDVGAHIGYYTLLLSGLVGPKGKVYAFEPDPVNHSLLKQNVAINGIKNVITVNKALTNLPGLRYLYKTRDSQNPSLAGVGESIPVYGCSLDDYLSGLHGRVDFIKMDIEGGEYFALLGMRKVIEQNPHLTLITEVFPEALERFGVSEQEYLSLLTSLGFTYLDVGSNRKVRNLICRRD